MTCIGVVIVTIVLDVRERHSTKIVVVSDKWKFLTSTTILCKFEFV